MSACPMADGIAQVLYLVSRLHLSQFAPMVLCAEHQQVSSRLSVVSCWCCGAGCFCSYGNSLGKVDRRELVTYPAPHTKPIHTSNPLPSSPVACERQTEARRQSIAIRYSDNLLQHLVDFVDGSHPAHAAPPLCGCRHYLP